jgi:hypothetical protein
MKPFMAVRRRIVSLAKIALAGFGDSEASVDFWLDRPKPGPAI